ncbi:LamG-like jellyroll fold domain-containing protein [Patescibacteria group bacterium]
MRKFISVVLMLFMSVAVNAATSTTESDYSFVPSGDYVDVLDVNASGLAVDVAFLGSDAATNQPLILLKDADTNEFIRYISVFDPDWTIGYDLKKFDDSNGNGYPELAVKGVDSATSEMVVQVVDSLTGLDITSITLSSTQVPPASDNIHSLDLESSSSQYASISDADQTGLDITGDFTIEAWVKLESQPSSSTMVIAGKFDDNLGARSYRLIYTESGGTLYIEGQYGPDGNSVHKTTKAHTLESGVWHHVAYIVDVSTSTGEIFVDGVSLGTATGTYTSVYNGGANFTLGASRAGSIEHFDGQIDDLRVWNVTRTQLEIQANANQELTGSEAGLVGYWKLNNDYQDATANGNHLTPVNGPVFSTDVPWENASTVSGSTNLTSGLISYWGFEEQSGTRSDSHGQNHLADNNTVQQTTGIVGYASRFDATNTEHLSITDGSQTDLDTSSKISIAAWIYWNGDSIYGYAVAKYKTAGDQRQYALYMDDETGANKLTWYIAGDGGTANRRLSQYGNVLADNTWYHVVVTHDTVVGESHMYIDGKEVALTTNHGGTVSSIYNGNGEFTIGSRDSGINPWDGDIDEVGIYSRILHYGDVLDLYNNGNGIPYTTP